MSYEETTAPSTARFGLRYGLLTGVALVIFYLLLQLLGLAENGALSSVSYLLLAAGIYLGAKAFREENGGYLRFGQGVGVGAFVSAVAGLINSMFAAFYVAFIDPEMMDRLQEAQRIEMENRGMGDAEIDQAMGFAAAFMSPTAIFILGIISMLIIGVIISLIISAVLKKDPPEFS